MLGYLTANVFSDYYSYHDYYNNSDPDDLPSAPVQPDNEMSKPTSTDELHLSDHQGVNGVKNHEQGEHNSVIHTIQVKCFFVVFPMFPLKLVCVVIPFYCHNNFIRWFKLRGYLESTTELHG